MSPTRLVKLAISAAVFACDQLCALLLRIFGKRSKGTCVVLYYHSVPSDQRARFAEQLDTIVRLAQVVDVTKEVKLPPASHRVGITFDDAFANFVSEALPELEKRNLPATMFVIAGALGKAFGPVAASERVMSVSQLRELPSGLITIGSHTMTHPFMPDLDEATADRELRESKSTLEAILGHEITTFSFPFGGFTNHTIELARAAGYQRVFTTLPQFAFGDRPHRFTVGRVRVDPSDWPLEFQLKLAGAYRWLPFAISWKRRLGIFKMNKTSTGNTLSTRSAIHELSTN